MAAAVLLTVPSIPSFSSLTSPEVSCCPGRMNTASLNVSPYRSLRPANVKKDRLAGCVTGISRRGPKIHTLIPTPIATTTRVSERDGREVQQARRFLRASAAHRGIKPADNPVVEHQATDRPSRFPEAPAAPSSRAATRAGVHPAASAWRR